MNESQPAEHQFYCLRDAIAFIEENPIPQDNDQIDVIEVPPKADALTDQEDFDDEIVGGGDEDPLYLPPDVPGSVELHQFHEDETASTEAATQPKKKRKKMQSVIWEKMQPSYSKLSPASNGAAQKTEHIKTGLKNKNPVEIFEMFFTEDLISTIRDQTLLYATQKNIHRFSSTNNCLRKFFGVLLFSGYHKLPSERLYWSLEEDFKVDIVRNSMPRNRFVDIKRFIHFVDNTTAAQSKDDKSFKIKPLMDHLNSKFKQFGVFSKGLSIDEQIVRYYGRSSLKQFIRGKPIRFGFKQWVLTCGVTGYCFQMDLYQGKEKTLPEQTVQQTLGSRVVLSMCDHLENPLDHEVYIDNFFTSYELLVHMRSLGLRVTGTVRSNRTAKCPLQEDKLMKKEGRGEVDFRFDEKEEILFVKWHDNSLFTVGTNHQTVELYASAQRWSKSAKKEITIPQPQLISRYNKFMGGVDHLDWLVQKYRIGIRSKKWYFSLFTNCLDVAIVNAWILHSMSTDSPLPLLQFKSFVAKHCLKLRSESDPKSAGRPKKRSANVVAATRLSPVGHVLERTDGGKQRKCAVCKKKVSKQCRRCDVGLHMGECFDSWHS